MAQIGLCVNDQGFTTYCEALAVAASCGQTTIVEGRRYYFMPGKFAKGARFSPVLGLLLCCMTSKRMIG
jgi:hypothetical protein